MALDLGCGLGVEVGRLAKAGFRAVGVDRSLVAVAMAATAHPGARFVGADVRSLPIGNGLVDVVLDRGCFHYLRPADRPPYEAEVRRVLRPGGRLLLRACRYDRGRRNDLDEALLRTLFGDWRILTLAVADIPGDNRTMSAYVARLESPGPG